MRIALKVVVIGMVSVVAACNSADDNAVSNDDAGPAVSTTVAPTINPDPATTTGTSSASTTEVSTTTQPDNASDLEWGSCDGAPTLAGLDQPECASIEVPLDYDNPDGEMIEIALSRYPAVGDDVIGSLVFNPGGPGASGIEFLNQVAFAAPPDLSERFDLVSFDPRGVGDSTAFDCDIDFDDQAPLVPDGDTAAFESVLSQVDENLASCPPEDMQMAPYLGTLNAARDLDQIRAAVGDEKLSYVGFSYGTRLGAVYAELFPDRVRALVLDGAVKPSTDPDALTAEQADGFIAALQSFAEACDDDPDCAVAGSGSTFDVISELQATIRQDGPFDAGHGRKLTAGEFDLAIISALYSKTAWEFLAEGLTAARDDQDGSILQALTDVYTGRQLDGTYDNSSEANLAINCADDSARPEVSDIEAAADEVADEVGLFADSFRAFTGCYGMPDSVEPLEFGPAQGAAPILVIGTTGDPATPFEWSVELADYLDSGVLYTVKGDGHTAFLTYECVTEPVVDYLIDLDVPAADSTCSDPSTDIFPPAGEGEIDGLITLLDCLRDNGLDIPEITKADLIADPNGESLLDYLDPENPDFLAAAPVCM